MENPELAAAAGLSVIKFFPAEACGGSYMAKSETIKAKDWGRITADCRKAVKISLGFELAHVGLNHDSEENALAGANALNALFGLGVKDGRASCFLRRI